VREPLLRDPDVPVEELRDGGLDLREEGGVVVTTHHLRDCNA